MFALHLLKIEAAYKSEVISTAQYLNINHKKYRSLNTIKNHEIKRNCKLKYRNDSNVEPTNKVVLH